MSDLERYIKAQEGSYDAALAEIRNGRKTSHWMWYIFPQIKGLGHSSTSEHYGIRSMDEAEEYVKHPVLGKRLMNISKELLRLPGSDAHQIFGSPDDMKLRSSMTLFSLVKESDPVFEEVLKKYFNGERDKRTFEIVGKVQSTTAEKNKS